MEKVYAEKLCQYFRQNYGLETHVVRFHNVYGPLGTYEGGKEKAPAAICRKAALAAEGSEIEVWGDGEQTRSFMYVDDCVEGIYRLMRSDYLHPLNLGTDELVSVNQLVDLVCEIAGKRLNQTPRSEQTAGRPREEPPSAGYAMGTSNDVESRPSPDVPVDRERIAEDPPVAHRPQRLVRS